MQHKVEICGVNTAKLKVLKSSETQALLLRVRRGICRPGRNSLPATCGWCCR